VFSNKVDRHVISDKKGNGRKVHVILNNPAGKSWRREREKTPGNDLRAEKEEKEGVPGDFV